LTKAECNCITQTAASRGGNSNKYSTLPEYWGSPHDYCNELHGGLDLTHIHVQRK
jgi:hypothetical protein